MLLVANDGFHFSAEVIPKILWKQTKQQSEPTL
jgi:hypothetical protein